MCFKFEENSLEETMLFCFLVSAPRARWHELTAGACKNTENHVSLRKFPTDGHDSNDAEEAAFL